MIKWIISDMDGTLLINEKELPADFGEVMAELKKAGIMFSPASGRQLETLMTTFAAYKKDLLIISENGTYVSKDGEEVFSATLPELLVKKVLAKIAQMKGVYPIISCKGVAYYNAKEPAFLEKLNIYYKANQYVEDFAQINTKEVLKLAFCAPEIGDARTNIYEPLLAEFESSEDIQIVLSGDIWTDVNPANINKGKVIEALQKKLNIKPEECMAFGDYLNDLEMMKAVKYSYAMANAVPEIKASANFQAPSNTEAGVTKVIKDMLKNGKEPVV